MELAYTNETKSVTSQIRVLKIKNLRGRFFVHLKLCFRAHRGRCYFVHVNAIFMRYSGVYECI